jgi:acyl-coenzyme A synthetase/AMP-(fatty) acid ligase/pimeloyl-ACP methyl ester carboxylesterase
LQGIDHTWSRRLTAPDGDGRSRSWHVLDNRAEPTTGTMVCVHGNPTWSYLWRRFLCAAPPEWRVVAVDQLGMGWSERVPESRRLAQRIDDLDALTTALDINGPVVTVAHDWGGPISLGWALRHRDRLAGMVLANTAVHHDPDTAAPGLIRLARAPRLRDVVCVRTPAFVRAAAALSRPALPRQVRNALAAPYRDAAARRAVGDFVADIPLEPDHPSRAVLDDVAKNLAELADVPALLLWGARDPVFTERYLDDLLDRLPHADVQRYPHATHLVTEDVPEAADHVWQWVGALASASGRPARPPARTAWPWAAQTARKGENAAAVTERRGGRKRTISFAELEQRISRVAAGLQADGVRPQDRVALLVPPGIDLTVAVYACWRVGAVIVVADAGLGVGGLAHALRSAGPEHVLGVGRALAAARLWRIPGQRIPVDRLREYAGRDRTVSAHSPSVNDEAAVLFTSGATGPAKGVVYTLAQLSAQIELVRSTYRLTEADRLVAAFAPFALYGPALGVGAVVPDMTVTAPGTLTATALADAAAAVDATVVFASPAALRNVVATAGRLGVSQRAALGRVRLVMSAGAPVPARLLRQVARLLPTAALHTPYGMTEALPVADISLPEIEQAGPGNGVCVGRPRPGVEVRLSPLDRLGRAEGELTAEPGVTGEICVAAAHVKLRYDRLWVIERASSRNPGWHRTGDVGHLDHAGRLWVEGRLVHLISAPDGPVTPVGIEQAIEARDEVGMAAVVGVGPVGTQQVVAVVVPTAAMRGSGPLAPPALATAVRAAAAATPLAAVLTSRRLPTDVRHASKIDRAAVADWADRVLAGRRPGRL